MERILISEKGERFTGAQTIYLNCILKIASKPTYELLHKDAQEIALKRCDMPYGFLQICQHMNFVFELLNSKNLQDRIVRDKLLTQKLFSIRRGIAKLYISGVLNLKLF